MADPTIPTYDEEYNIILQGFDVSIVPSDQGPGYYYVTLYESGTEVFADDVEMPEPQPGEVEEESIQNLAQAAIDIFEASRGTLGEGAGINMSAKRRIKSCGIFDYHEQWFMGFKGTQYEDMAYDLLKNYYGIEYEQTAQDDILYELYDKQYELEYQLKMTDLERMKAMAPNTQIIVIQGKRAYLGDSDMYKEFLAKFKGDPLEGKIVKLLSELLDVNHSIRQHVEGQDSYFDQLRELEFQMEALSEEALQANVLSRIPTEGIEAFPNMAGQVAELMEGVEMDEPLEPMMANPFQAAKESVPFQSRTPDGYLVKGEVQRSKPYQAPEGYNRVFSPAEIFETGRKQAQMTPPEEPDDTYAKEWEPVEERIEEKGEEHEGLDPAEVLIDTFTVGEKVKLKRKLEVPGPMNGVKKIFESGATGYIDSLYDRHGDCYMVAFEKGGLVRVPAEFLTKTSK